MQPRIAANIQEQQASSRRDGQGDNRHWLKPSDKKSGADPHAATRAATVCSVAAHPRLGPRADISAEET
jgi:hypothetical protein